MGGNMTFREAVDSWKPRPKEGENYYEEIIHALMDAGVEPLPPCSTIEQALERFEKLVREKLDTAYEEIVEQLVRDGRPELKGWVVLENHERARPIKDFIRNRIATSADLSHISPAYNKWLLPVTDDKEYVSWHFILVPKNIDTVLTGIKWMLDEIDREQNADHKNATSN
jgi:hypothetical protein